MTRSPFHRNPTPIRIAALLGAWGLAAWLPAARADSIAVLFLGGSSGSHRTAEMCELARAGLRAEGIELDYTEDVARLAPESLGTYAVAAVYRDHGELPPEAEQALVDFVSQGRGLLAVHCASHCFRNSERYTRLVGGRFARHGGASFRARIVDAQHPALRGVRSFESWDETYVHDQLTDDRRVVMARLEEGGYEPYGWTRSEGQGRVYYTALGHDERTWRRAEFQRLLAQAVKWLAGLEVDVPPAAPRPAEPIGGPVPPPHSPAESMRRMHLPEGFRVEPFAAEPEIVKPLAMNFDERGRVWIVESLDYPNTVLPTGRGHDRIKLCEDTDGDGRADRFTVFAEGLNIPTSLLPTERGLLVAEAPDIALLRDTDGDGRADRRDVLFTGFGRDDTHAVVSNLHYGLDNWIYATCGYSGGQVEAAGRRQRFRQCLLRFRLDGSDFEVLAATSNNTWGLGIGPAGDVFASTANDEHSLHLAIPNRYFERVRGWHGQGLAAIADHARLHPVCDDIRQVDFHGRFTAASGHEIYAARQFPDEYHDRAALVCEPTGHLVHVDFLEPRGASFVAREGFNLLASDDPWTAPTVAMPGPDGSVWIIDWYNYIVRHNPTPPGFETGAGNAYVTPDRDQAHGRIYRIVYDPQDRRQRPRPAPRLDTDGQLVAALSHENFFWRLTAQRLLVERRRRDARPALEAVLRDDQATWAKVHALWALAGLDALPRDADEADSAFDGAFDSPLAAVRRAAAGVWGAHRIGSSNRALRLLHDPDPHVQLAALLARADQEAEDRPGEELIAYLERPGLNDPRLIEAATAACARDATPSTLLATRRKVAPGSPLESMARTVAGHFARQADGRHVGAWLKRLPQSDPVAAEAVLQGVAAGWPADHPPPDDPEVLQSVLGAFDHLSAEAQAQLAALALRWKLADRLAPKLGPLRQQLAARLADAEAEDAARVLAAQRLIALAGDEPPVEAILDAVTSSTPPELAQQLFLALAACEGPGVAEKTLDRWSHWTPAARRSAFALLASRPGWTSQLLSALDADPAARDDLTLDQVDRLLRHPDATLAARAQTVLASRGGRPSPDRAAVLARFAALAERPGDAAAGRAVFERNCAKCHRHGALGASIAPDLSGMAVRRREELLIDILDPNRSVEGNYRQYTLVKRDGIVLTGLLAGETRTTVELIDAEAQRHTVDRRAVEELIGSRASFMPEGFEQIGEEPLTDLLAFLAARGRYVPLPLGKVATIASDRGMFYSRESEVERLVLPRWGAVEHRGVPFQVVDPQDGRTPNCILLTGPQGAVSGRMPRRVEVPCGLSSRTIHLLGGVSGWGWPLGAEGSSSLVVRLRYADGQTEEHVLQNGVHLADYIRRVDVPRSEFAFDLAGRQLRYLSIAPARPEAVIDAIEFAKGDDATAPVVMAVTVEIDEPSSPPR